MTATDFIAQLQPLAPNASLSAVSALDDDINPTVGVSAALWACTAPSHYADAPVGFQVPWGAGPFLVAARAPVGG